MCKHTCRRQRSWWCSSLCHSIYKCRFVLSNGNILWNKVNIFAKVTKTWRIQMTEYQFMAHYLIDSYVAIYISWFFIVIENISKKYPENISFDLIHCLIRNVFKMIYNFEMVFSLLLDLPINLSVQNFHCLCPYTMCTTLHTFCVTFELEVKSQQKSSIVWWLRRVVSSLHILPT